MCNIYVNYNRKPNKYFLFRLVRRPVKTCRVVILQCIAEVFLLELFHLIPETIEHLWFNCIHVKDIFDISIS